MRYQWLSKIFFFTLVSYLGAYLYQPIVDGKGIFLWAMEPDSIADAEEQTSTQMSFKDYRSGAEDRLIDPTSKKETLANLSEMNIEKPATTSQDIGLKLLGTVVAEDPETRVAVIDDRNTQKQDIFHEGDSIGQIVIKRILRNAVIISTKSAEMVLNMNFEGTEKETPVIEKTEEKQAIKKNIRRKKRVIKRIGTRDRRRKKRRAASAQARLESASAPEKIAR